MPLFGMILCFHSCHMLAKETQRTIWNKFSLFGGIINFIVEFALGILLGFVWQFDDGDEENASLSL